MSVIKITYSSQGKCNVVHESSGSTIQTDLPKEYGGTGNSFSATDLLAAALGVCIATNIDKIAGRHEIPLDQIEIQVQKTLSLNPKKISLLHVSVNVQIPIPEDVKRKMNRAAHACLVHQSLHPDLNVEIKISAKSRR